MGSDASPIIVVEHDPSAVATDASPTITVATRKTMWEHYESAVATGNCLLTREEASRLNRRQHRPNNTDGRNTICRYDCNRMEGATANWCPALANRGGAGVFPHSCREVEEAVLDEDLIRAVYNESASTAGHLLEIRKLAAKGASPNACLEHADAAIEIHARIQQTCGTIANAMKRLRQDLKIAKKRQRTQEVLVDWNEHEVYRLRCQVDTILGLQRRPKLYHDVTMNALQEELDYSDAASSTSARPSENREEDGNSSGGPPHCEVVGRSE